ncbi:Threonine--tRNA ligase [compost metagenome]
MRNEKLGYKIREAQLEKIPYMFVVGENEKSSNSVSVRKRGEGDLGAKALDEVLALLQDEIRNHVI